MIEKVDPESLVEAYALLGGYSMESATSIEMESFRETIGEDAEGAVYQLWTEGVVDYSPETDRVRLKNGKSDQAEKIAKLLYREGMSEEEILEEENLPENPVSGEQALEPLLESAASPSLTDDFYTRLFEVVPEEEGLKPYEIEEKLPGEPTFDLESHLAYLETQGVLERHENERYRLVRDKVDNAFLGERMPGLKEEQRYGKDPHKP